MDDVDLVELDNGCIYDISFFYILQDIQKFYFFKLMRVKKLIFIISPEQVNFKSKLRVLS